MAPQDFSILANLGIALVTVQDNKQAIPVLQKALRLRPGEFTLQFNLALAHTQSGDPAGALAPLRDAIRQKPDLARLHVVMGNTLSDMGLHQDAIDCFREAIRLQPEDPTTYLEFARFRVQCPDTRFRDLAEAASLAEEAMALNPNQVNYWADLADLFYRMNHWEQARIACEKALEIRPEDPSSGFILVMARWQLLEEEIAKEWFDKAQCWMEASPELIYLPWGIEPDGKGYVGTYGSRTKEFRDEAASLLGVQQKDGTEPVDSGRR